MNAQRIHLGTDAEYRPADTMAWDEEPSAAEEPLETILEHIVPEELHGMRLDAVCAQLFPIWSRARLKNFIEDGRVLLDGTVSAKPRLLLQAGQSITLNAIATQEVTLVAQDIPLNVVYSDADILVLNKPAGLTVHPGAGTPDKTLQNGLLFHYPKTAMIPRSGLIHRLDKDTTGLMVVALSEAAHRGLSLMMAQREVQREYDALVNGALVTGGTVDEPIARHPRERIRMAVIPGGRTSVTHYKIAERFQWHTLLKVQLETGRTHQIRVHMAHIRHPVAGDPVYGGDVLRARGSSPALRTAVGGFRRQALHAARLAFEHPVTGQAMAFEVPRPSDFAALLSVLRRESPP